MIRMPLITQISPQRRSPNRRNIYIDGQFAFGCHLNVVARFRLREGLEISADQITQIQAGEVRQDCFDTAMRSLQLRQHGRIELKKKLDRKEFGPAIVNGVLDDLERMGYLDDARFAATRAAASAEHKHHGKRRAYIELVRRGIATDIANEALAKVYDRTDTLAIARELARKQSARLSRLEPLVARRRLVGMLQRRGFDYEDIKPVIDEFLGREID